MASIEMYWEMHDYEVDDACCADDADDDDEDAVNSLEALRLLIANYQAELEEAIRCSNEPR